VTYVWFYDENEMTLIATGWEFWREIPVNLRVKNTCIDISGSAFT
jgi:hypothetical protein